MTIKWTNIREPNLYGYSAELGIRSVEVLRTEPGVWEVFPRRNGRQVWSGASAEFDANAYRFDTAPQARQAAAGYLRTGEFAGVVIDDLPLASKAAPEANQ